MELRLAEVDLLLPLEIRPPYSFFCPQNYTNRVRIVFRNFPNPATLGQFGKQIDRVSIQIHYNRPVLVGFFDMPQDRDQRVWWLKAARINVQAIRCLPVFPWNTSTHTNSRAKRAASADIAKRL
jgi:hypothetical protein